MNFNDVIKNRFSVRKFADKPVDSKVIDSIIDTVMTAPTALNLQPVHTYVVTDKEMLEKIDTASPCRYGATCVFAVCYDEENCWTSVNGDKRGVMDASIAATYIMLKATDEGLGSCWVCRFDANILREVLNIPKDLKPECLIMVGHTDKDAQPADRHTIRKPIDEAFTRL